MWTLRRLLGAGSVRCIEKMLNEEYCQVDFGQILTRKQLTHHQRAQKSEIVPPGKRAGDIDVSTTDDQASTSVWASIMDNIPSLHQCTGFYCA